MIGCGWRLVRVLGLWVGIGQNGIWPGISQNTRILCWSWSKGSDSAGHWSEHSDFGLVLAKAIRFGWALVRTFGFWAGVGQSDQIWLGIGQSTRILGWSWSKMLRFGWPLIRTPRIFLASMKICVGKSFSECKISYRIEPQKVTLFRANATRIRWSVGWSVGRSPD